MDMVIIGTDHELEVRDECFEKLITEITESENIVLIGEEIPAPTIAQKVALRRGIRWVQIDMSREQRIKASVEPKLANRMQIRSYDANGMPVLALRYAPKEDGEREEFWLDRIEEMKVDGGALIVCGGLHARPLSEKAQRRGHRIKLLFHPETLSQFWISIQPELF